MSFDELPRKYAYLNNTDYCLCALCLCITEIMIEYLEILCHFISFPACLLDINCANIGYEGKHVTFHISYPEGYETNTKYFGKKDGFFFEKLVQTSHPYRWAKQGRFALFDNTSARILTATILQLVVDDSGLYSFGVDVKLSPDLSGDIQLTVRRGENPFTGLIGYESVFSHT